MNPQTQKYLHALEFAAIGAIIPVINGWLHSNPTDWHTALKALLSAVLIGVWTYVRMNPPPLDPASPTP